jgi:DNA-binding MarR family transcriptional regulator
VTTQRRETDRRSISLTLTRTGRELITRLRRQADVAMDKDMSHAQRTAIVAYLDGASALLES